MKCKRNIYNDSFLNTDGETSDLQKELIHADVRQQAVVVEEEILQAEGSIALNLFIWHFVFLLIVHNLELSHS